MRALSLFADTSTMQADTKNVNLLQLEALVHLVEERSFSRAAKRMYLSQPSLTKHIRNLEDALGAKVVNRASRAFTLTPEGRVTCDYARRILKLREEAMDRVMRVRETEAGDIRIAASTIPATYILPAAIAGFRDRFPGIGTAVRAADSSDVIEMVLENGAELGFIGKKPASTKLVRRVTMTGSRVRPLASRMAAMRMTPKTAPVARV